MATGRMLKRNISESRRLSELKSDSARLLWTWIIPYLDADGRFFASASMIKGKVVPRLPTFTVRNIPKYLNDMARVGLITLYEVDGEKLLEYRKFNDFQKIVKDREARSLPAPNGGKELSTYSRPAQDEVDTKSGLLESNLIQSNLIQFKAKGNPDEGPVDNSKENEETFTVKFGSLMRQITDKYPDQHFQRKVVLFVESHISVSNQDAIIRCLEQLHKCQNPITNPKAYLESILAVENGNYNERESIARHEELKGSREGDGAAMERLGNILKKVVSAPELPKEECHKCHKFYITGLMENGNCIFCNDRITTIKCPGCTRTVGKNVLNRETGVCIHCEPPQGAAQ
jgi:hypothetical protein